MKFKNMKGFIFTLDSVFALIVAISGISILLYTTFVGTGSYHVPVFEAYSILQSLLQTTTAGAATGSVYASYISGAGMSFSTWPQHAHDSALSSASTYGPQVAYVLYTYKASGSINPIVAVDQGVAAFASGTNIYAINASTGNTVKNFPISGAQILYGPAIYKNEILYADTNNVIHAVSASNGLQLWTTTVSKTASTPLEIENNYLAFSGGNTIFLLNLFNGTLFASNTVPVTANVQTPAYGSGEFVVSTEATGQNYLYSYALFGNNLFNVWNAPVGTGITTSASFTNNTIAVGSGSALYILGLSGNLIKQSTPLNGFVRGVSSVGNNIFIETSNAVYEFNNTGTQFLSYNTVTTSQNSTPSVASGTIYTLVNGKQFEAFSTQLSRQFWNITLPTTSSYNLVADVALAYGNAYVASGNTVYVFGTYKALPGDSLLQSLANMYTRNESGYANLLLNSIYKSNTVGLYINGTYAPDLSVAAFNGVANYVQQSNGFVWMDNAVATFTISLWINPASNNGIVVDEYANNGGWHDSWIELVNGNVFARVNSGPCINIGPAPNGKWSHVVMDFDGTNFNAYLNGVFIGTTGPRTVPAGGTTPMYYPLGLADSINCGSGGGYYTGQMLNYQFYNQTLTGTQITQLYQSGAFGFPLQGSGITMWWPLAGDYNDYSNGFNPGFAYPYSTSFNLTSYAPAQLRNSYQVSSASVPVTLSINGNSRLYNVSVVIWR